MFKLIFLILATCMIGEAGWTQQIYTVPLQWSEPEEVESEVANDIYYDADEVVMDTSNAPYEEPATTSTDDDSDLLYLGAHRVTGYTWTGNTMANGVYPSYGWCACNGLDLGTEVYIDGLGYFIVGDRGGMTDPYWIDIYFDTVSECYSVTGYYDIYVVK